MENAFRFKKKFGQNFLTDANLLDAIVRDAGVEPDTTVLEIGAGAGALTRALAKTAKRVVAYEIDPDLKPVLAQTLSGSENVEVVFRDFMREDLPRLEGELGQYRVVANLPYYITTPLLMKFVEEAENCLGFCVMVQEEVAERFCAQAGSPAYGAVSAAIARRGTCRMVRKVPRTMFTPRPNVDSAVVRADFGEQFPVASVQAYRETVRAAFASRRKTLENNLMQTFRLSRTQAREALSAAGVPEGVRGETLSPKQLGTLSDVLVSKRILK